MSFSVHQGQLVNHSYAVDSLVTQIRAQASALQGIKLGTDTFGLLNFWMPPVLNSFFLTDGDTVLDMADTVGRAAEAVRSTAQDFDETDAGVADGFGCGS